MNIIHKSIRKIPYTEFNFGKDIDIVFFHANAFPPKCYIPFFYEIGKTYNIICPHFRPLWDIPGSSKILLDWSPLKNDMVTFLENYGLENYNISGHSLGGHIAFRIALENPDLVKKSVLMDPIIFPRFQMFLWKFIQWVIV